jgi:hypothetical protein
MQCSNMCITFNAMPCCCSCQRFLVYLYVFLEKFIYMFFWRSTSISILYAICMYYDWLWLCCVGDPLWMVLYMFVPQIRSCRLFCWLIYGENLRSKQHNYLKITYFLYFFIKKECVYHYLKSTGNPVFT